MANISDTISALIINESSYKQARECLNIVKISQILSESYLVHNNLKNNFFDSSALAIKFIDANLSLFESYSYDGYKNEIKKLDKYNVQSVNALNEDISYLIETSISNKKNDPLKYVQSYENVLNNLTTKKEITEQSNTINEDAFPLDLLIKKCQQILDEKYNGKLNTEEKEIVTIFLNESEDKKIELFNNYRDRAVENIKKENGSLDENVYKQAIEKLESMKYNDETFIDDFISIYDLVI